jgi:tetratricopeptide (TPR) repeat protein
MYVHSGDKGIEYYNKALELNPNFAFAWKNKAVLLDQLGKHDEAFSGYIFRSLGSDKEKYKR